MKAPRMGPDWSQLAELAGKLASSERALTDTEADWLLGLLNSLLEGEDVLPRFFGKTGRPRVDEQHFWMLCDVARLEQEGETDACKAAEARWPFDAPTIRRTRDRKAVSLGARPMPANLIDYHRKRFFPKLP